ncbi:dual specificity protein phosphatase family protein [Frigoriglobus tundricola]|uniref:Tyrosine specific protein phosphatases domain-containing protein n=1 Tax=Frigoriglobus tundricola TaxID=2774151 RepID=A0A6M5YS18_9BACT|nr:dual specificity protein phosphatase family protein [Frigoriglobus tundricola]QJW96073.1 hypothetical protein FTUN_3627 [Frigoriglobus tundricola]
MSAYGLVFAALAALAVATGALAREWVLRAGAAAVALSFLVVAVAYSGAGPRLLFKSPTGRRFVWAWGVHWPFFVFTAFAYHLSRLLTREAAHVRVAPNVFLGRRLSAREARHASAEGWLAVLDLAAELPEAPPLRTVTHYRSLPVLDATAMSLQELRAAVEWVTRHAASGPVYVHCALGHGRSAVVVAAYLIATGQAPDAPAALKHLRERRPGVRLHRSQRRVLDQFAGEG